MWDGNGRRGDAVHPHQTAVAGIRGADRTFALAAYLLSLGVENGVSPLTNHSLVFSTDWET